MIKAVIFNMSMQNYSLREIENLTGMPVDQMKELLDEISYGYQGGMEIFRIADNATYIEKACMETGNKLFEDLLKREYENCVSKGYPCGIAKIYTRGYVRGILRALAKGHSEWSGGRKLINSEWVVGYAQGYILGRFEAKDILFEVYPSEIHVADILGVTDQEYEEIKDITVDDLKTKYGMSE